MKNLIYILLFLPIKVFCQAPTSTENYIKTKTYKVPVTSSLPTPTPDQCSQNVTYFDGLGRPIQQNVYANSNLGKDIVTHIEYDPLGRQVKEYLPFYSGQNTMGIIDSNTLKTNLQTQYQNKFGDNNPYSEKLIESSPLNRILEQAAPGNDWDIASPVSHTIKTFYETNIANEVKMFKATSLWNPGTGLFDISLFNGAGNTFYPANELHKTITKNENWIASHLKNNTTEEFKDKEGRIILKRAYNANITHDTYYIYDQFGNLTYVIPPKADANITQTVLDELCYQYKYDYKNRLVEKKIPGKQWEFVVYDKLDRVVATGPVFSPFTDFNAPNNVGWMLTKYDYLNRTILTAWLQSSTVNTTDRYNLQTLYNNILLPVNESKSTTDQINGANSFNTRYTNNAIPSTYATAYHALTVNYYDDYTTNITFTPAISYTIPSITPQPVYYNTTNLPKGMPTISWVRIPEASGVFNAEKSYTLYDIKGRVVRSFSNNYLGGYTQTESQLETITGRTNYTIITHKRLSTDNVITVREDFNYSAQDRLLAHIHTINNGTPELIADNTYDELGQLITKKVGNTTSSSVPLQTIDYRYNIRGWLLAINDPYDLKLGTENDMFGFYINYNNPILHDAAGKIKPLYNGNIAETSWRTANDDILRRYGYRYDNLNRIIDAVYQKPETSVPIQNSYDESVTYDKNGNIMSIQRNGDFDDEVNVLNIDNLTYFYDQSNTTNRLMKVTDTTNSTIGFKDDSTGYNDTVDDFSYDANGNMIKDDNKGIASIKYNHLNLPTEIIFTATKKILYLYNASGKKVKKMVTTNGSSYTVTDYLDGYQYDKVGSGAVKLLFFPHAEGYVNNTVSGGVNNYNYVFNYTDHLGNIRASYIYDVTDPLAPGPRILEESHYYPFGLKHTKYNIDQFYYDSCELKCVIKVPNLPFKYKYNGKEYQDELGLNVYDYGAMMYDPALGRRNNIDPKAEESRRWSTYSYCYNNPIRFVDPDGMKAIPTPLEAAYMSKHAYGEGGKLIGGWAVSKAGKGLDLTNEKTGFKSQVYQRTVNGKTEYTYATAGTQDMKDAKQDVKQVFGISEQMKQSVEVAGKLQDKVGDAEVTNTGHSLGGVLAEANANATGNNAITFNAAGLSVFSPGGLQKSTTTNAYIVTTDPLNAGQSLSGIPTAGGAKHFISPGSTQGATNGHSIDTVIEALQTHSVGQYLSNSVNNVFK